MPHDPLNHTQLGHQGWYLWPSPGSVCGDRNRLTGQADGSVNLRDSKPGRPEWGTQQRTHRSKHLGRYGNVASRFGAYRRSRWRMDLPQQAQHGQLASR